MERFFDDVLLKKQDVQENDEIVDFIPDLQNLLNPLCSFKDFLLKPKILKKNRSQKEGTQLPLFDFQEDFSSGKIVKNEKFNKNNSSKKSKKATQLSLF